MELKVHVEPEIETGAKAGSRTRQPSSPMSSRCETSDDDDEDDDDDDDVIVAEALERRRRRLSDLSSADAVDDVTVVPAETHITSGKQINETKSELSKYTQVLQQEAYPAIWPLLMPKTRPSLGLSPK